MNSDTDQSEDEMLEQQNEADSPSYDSLLRFSIPEAVGKLSTEINETAQNISDRIKWISAASQEMTKCNNREQAHDYVEARQSLADDAFMCIRQCKNVVSELRKNQQIDSPTAKRAHKELDDSDAELLKERAALAANSVKLEYSIMSNPTRSRLGKAYLSCIVENLSEPAGARVHKQKSRGGSDLTSFRKRVLNSYNPPGWNADPPNPVVWCPVSKERVAGMVVTASHIVPYEIGEVNAAYLFGLEPQNGYEAIWDVRNGLPLVIHVEKAWDAAQLVIIEDDTPNNLKLVVLDENIMNNYVDIAYTKRFRDVHNQRLEFLTDARPGRRQLYLHYLLTLFRRKMYNVEGWEKDTDKTKSGYI